jgi:hypothetical protein
MVDRMAMLDRVAIQDPTAIPDRVVIPATEAGRLLEAPAETGALTAAIPSMVACGVSTAAGAPSANTRLAGAPLAAADGRSAAATWVAAAERTSAVAEEATSVVAAEATLVVAAAMAGAVTAADAGNPIRDAKKAGLRPAFFF